jgi:ankyrin repeat protein
MIGILNGRNAWWMVPVLSVALLGAAPGDVRLIQAVKAGDVNAVRALLKSQVDVNATEPDGATALHWATHRNDLLTVELLIAAGARVNAANDYGIMPLNLACTNGSAAMVNTLLKAGADIRAVPATGETPLMTAVMTGKTDVVEVLMEHEAEVNAKEPSGQTALMWAAGQGHLDLVNLLIKRGADVNARSASGFTPMLFAARHGSVDITRALLAAGAGINEKATDGATALVVATVRGNTPLAMFLLDEGADPNADDIGYTPLHWAVFYLENEFTGEYGTTVESGEWSTLSGLRGAAKVELVKALLAHGANPNARTTKRLPSWGHVSGGVARRGDYLIGATPFLLAAKAGDVTIMRLLWAAGADPLVPTSDNTTSLMVASGYGRVFGMSSISESSALDAVKLALETGANVQAENESGETALHGAAYQGWDSIVQLLVDRGAKINVKNRVQQGFTPLSIAEGNVFHSGGNHRHDSTAALLRKLGAVPDETSR